ncbi:MAG: tetratricopeptide repeat-containing sulfotransferase family protein [Caulobacterales bacterium]
MTVNLEAEVQRAGTLRLAGRWAEAVAAYHAILAHRPDLLNCWYNLAFCLRRAGLPEAALKAYQEALDRGIKEPEEVRLNRAVILLDDLHRDQEGEAELHMALTHDPDYAPALMNLANLAEDRGRRAVALSTYERILALPGAPHEALARYLSLKGATGVSDPLIQQAATAINAPHVQPEDKASLAFAMGKALDVAGDYPNAFEAYALANRIARAMTPPNQRYNPSAHEQLIDAIIEAFPKAEQPPDPHASKPELVFICGLFRSGSTLCEQVVSGHPRITPGGERPTLPRQVATTLAPFPQRIAAPDLAAVRATYLNETTTLFPNADILTDKRPDNFLYIGLIKRLFPSARIVHTVRQAKDNALSLYFLNLDASMSYAQDLTDIAHYIGQYRRLMAHWQVCFPQDLVDFHYDDFVQAPRQAMEPILRTLGLDWNDQLLSFHERVNRVRTASVWQVREPLYTRSSGRWQNYTAHLQALAGL